MEPHHLALARSHTYSLLSRLYLDPVTEALLPFVQAIPALAAALPTPFDLDDAAADHQTLFGFNVFPYESIFLGTDGLLGGPIRDNVLTSYRAAGYTPVSASESPDHVGHQLGLLGFLSRAEADAWDHTAGRLEILLRFQHLQRDFLDRHLLRWLPPLCLALRQQGQPFYTALANLTLEFVTDHRVATENDPSASLPKTACPRLRSGQDCANRTGLENRSTTGWSPSASLRAGLPSAPALLEDEKTSLRDLAAYLLTPAYSGVYLSRNDIGRLARQRQVPRGFGERQQMLLNLLRSAATYDKLNAHLDDLRVLLNQWQAAYTEMARQPELRPFADVWLARAADTTNLLTAMQQQLPS